MSDQSRHHELCHIAARWLSGSMRCNAVLSGVAACNEVPDAIGWSTSSAKRHYGSIVVECKNSMSDFRRERHKKFRRCFNRATSLDEMVEIPRMGDWRYFLCPAGVVSAEAVAKYFPDHGLLHRHGSRVHVIVPAPARSNVAHVHEVRLLQFALLHIKGNLLYAGLSVNMHELTRHPVIADREGLLDGFTKTVHDEEAWLG